MSIRFIREALELEISALTLKAVDLHNHISQLRFMVQELSDEREPTVEELFNDGEIQH